MTMLFFYLIDILISSCLYYLYRVTSKKILFALSVCFAALMIFPPLIHIIINAPFKEFRKLF